MAYSPFSSLSGRSSSGSHFDPNQPRVPAGQPGGGQWTSLGSLLGAEGGASEARDSASEADRASGSGLPPNAAQLAFSGSEANVLPRVPGIRRLFRSQPLPPEYAARLYEVLSAQNGPDGQTVLDLRAYGFTHDASGAFNFTHAYVERLTREQVEKACRRFMDVQAIVDNKYKELINKSPYLSRGQLGTALHLAIKKEINGMGKENFRAEVSYWNQKEGEDEKQFYGWPGSVRPDVREKSASVGEEGVSLGAALERLNWDTFCVYEVSIGQKNMGPGRPMKLGPMVQHAFPGQYFPRIIVTQVRPSMWRRGR